MDKKVRLAHKHFIHTDDPENWGYDYTDGKFKNWVFYGYRNSVREDYVNKLYHLHEDLLAAKTEAHHKQIEVEEAKKHLSGCYVNHKKAPDSSTLEKLRLATNSYHIIRDAWKAQATEVIQLRTKLKNAERKLNRLCEEFPSELLDKNLSSQWKTKKAGLLSDKRFALKWQNIIDIIKDEKAVHHIGKDGSSGEMLTGNITKTITQVASGLKDSLGIDLGNVVSSMLAGKLAGKELGAAIDAATKATKSPKSE